MSSTIPSEPTTTTPIETVTHPSTKIEEVIQDPTHGSDAGSEDEEVTPALNTIDDLGKGKINTRKGKKEFTILIVGETGTGKTTVLSLIANVLKGNVPLRYEGAHKAAHEAGHGEKHSQANEEFLYSFESNNGVRFNFLDTPGLTNTQDFTQGKQHTESIVQAIKNSTTAIDAILILANGTVPRLGVATDYALSILSSIFPITFANNISFLFTNVCSPLSWNFEEASLPEALRDNPLYLLDNPVAMQDKYTREKKKMEDQSKVDENLLNKLNASILEANMKALGELVKIFDWLDTLSPHSTKDIVSLYNQSQAFELEISNLLAMMTQIGEKKRVLHRIQVETDGMKLTMEQYKEYEDTDPVAKKKYDDAMSEKVRQEFSMDQLKKSIAAMDTAFAESTAKLRRLTEDYTKHSPSGSIGQAKKLVALLELSLETMRANGPDPQIIESVQNSLSRIQEKLVLVKKSKGQTC